MSLLTLYLYQLVNWQNVNLHGKINLKSILTLVIQILIIVMLVSLFLNHCRYFRQNKINIELMDRNQWYIIYAVERTYMAWNEPGNKDPWGRNKNNNSLDGVFKDFKKTIDDLLGSSGSVPPSSKKALDFYLLSF